ncbi:MAG: hypothetical protein ACOYXT_14815 [Bacteroidota bacterium]
MKDNHEKKNDQPSHRNFDVYPDDGDAIDEIKKSGRRSNLTIVV